MSEPRCRLCGNRNVYRRLDITHVDIEPPKGAWTEYLCQPCQMMLIDVELTLNHYVERCTKGDRI